MNKHIFLVVVTGVLILSIAAAWADNGSGFSPHFMQPITSPDSGPLPFAGDSIPYPLEDREGDFINDPVDNPIDLDDPAGIEQNVEYDPETDTYTITETIGGQYYRPPTYMSFDEFWEHKQNSLNSNYWGQKSSTFTPTEGDGLIPKLYSGNELFNRLFGSDIIEIRPTGSIDMEIGFSSQRIDNPALLSTVRNQPPQFLFDMGINVGVIGKIGDKLKINTNYNTKAIFDFENQIKLEYTGDEDEIIQELRAGHINFPLPTTLIPGSQSLFGVQAKLKFGRLTVNTVVSQQKSRAKQIQLESGAQTQEFELIADQYDQNRHFFIGQYFKDKYQDALTTLPYINSEVTITRIEVYVNDTRGTPEDVQRDIVALTDLGENQPYNINTVGLPGADLPENNSNSLYRNLLNTPNTRELDQITGILENPAGVFQLQNIQDFNKTQARKLDPDEFTYDPQLGFISLNFALRPNEVLGVAYEYTTIYGGQYQVGEFAEDIFSVDDESDQRVMFLKMLKTSTALPKHPMWDLMMKNVYALGAYQVEQLDFKLDVYYENPGGGDLRYIPEGEGIQGFPLIKILNLDRLNSNNEPFSDGIFDFYTAARDFDQQSTVPSNALRYGTINTRNGRLIFPVLEPFGDHLRSKFEEDPANTEELADKYVYDYLYDSTRTMAAEFPEFNRFFIKGTYKSSVSSEISLGAFNIPPGSVRLTAGGRELIEDVDYQVDYNLGRVTLLNEAYVTSGTPVQVSFEDNATFGIQKRTYLGTRLDYWINDNFSLGGTYVRLSERPFTQKVNYGDDPIANSMVGLDGNYYKETPGLTKLIDKLPGIETRETSSVSFNTEVAGFLPGHSKAITKEGTVYIDDFEGANTEYDLKFPYTQWALSSPPVNAYAENGAELFPEARLTDSLANSFNRAKISWYQLDNIFASTRGGNTLPPDVTSSDALSNHYTRSIREQELFPNKQSFTGSVVIRTFDLAYYPREKGPYNFDTKGLAGISAGVDQSGRLLEPASRWGGIMRDSPYKDFEQANVEFIEFWMMDPFMYNTTNEGDLYINLGNVSEDVLKDAKQFYENALPGVGEVSNLDDTNWGKVPKIRPVTFAFDNDGGDRELQDIGYDGMNDELEFEYHSEYIAKLDEMLASGDLTQEAYDNFVADPSQDNFFHFRDSYYDDFSASDEVIPGENILRRYKDFNGPEGNSPVQNDIGNYSISGTNFPEVEDMNQNKALNDSEEYYQYRIPLRSRDQMQVGEGYLADFKDTLVTLANGEQDLVRWYYFKVPVSDYSHKSGNVNLRNIEFLRMFLTKFEDPVVCRFARLNLVRNTWRRYQSLIREEGEYQPANTDDISESFFNLSAVSIEENAAKFPIPYVLPPGIERELFATTTANLEQNEQSIQVQVGDLKDGEAKAIYKRVNMDMRRFRKLRMFTHVESLNAIESCTDNTIEDGDVTAFVRIGDDFQNNYYEYEIPLRVTKSDDFYRSLGNADNRKRRWVWPEENEFVVTLQDLVDTKVERNFTNPPHPYEKPFVNYIPTTWDSTRNIRVTVVGSPDLGKVKQIMLGVRNPKRSARTKEIDDGFEKCADVWFNELRLADFDESAGWAALARMDVKLADLGNFAASTNLHTAGFGTLEQRVHERFQDNYADYDLSTNLNLGKFLPEKSGIRIPVYAGMSKTFSNPEYDPYDTDVRTKRNIDSIRLFHGADSARLARKQRQTVTSLKTITATNVRKERTNSEKKPKPWDIENWSATYAYTETEMRDPIIESDKEKRHSATLNYSYNARPSYIEPFKKLIKSKSLYLRLIKDINFNLVPSNVTFRNDWNRMLGELKMRALTPGEVIETYYNKSFTWDRYYALKYNPTRSIAIDFTANNRSVIDEPQIGRTPRDTIWSNMKTFGRVRNYDQTANISYNLPLDKIPLLAWTQVRTRYSSSYYWQGAPISPINGGPSLAERFGNVIGNSQNKQINAELNFTKLYNSVPFLKKVNSTRNNRKKPTPKNKDKNKDKDPAATDDKKKPAKTNKNAINPVTKALVRPLLILRRVSLTYNDRSDTRIPGYDLNSKYFGMNWGSGPYPGWGFVLGAQPELRSWLEWAAEKDLLVESQLLNDQVRQSRNTTINMRANLEPFRDFKVDLNMNLTHSLNHSEFYKVDETGAAYKHLSKIDVGSYTISYLTWKTMFDKIDAQNISETFTQFEDNRPIISDRLQESNPFSGDDQFYSYLDSAYVNNYYEGYGPYSQDVLVPAFLAAYTGRSASKINLNPFNMFPMPNWRVTYNGLSKIPALQRFFSTVNLSHSYSSTLTINNYRNNLDFDDRYYSDEIVLINQDGLIDLITQENMILAQEGDIDTLTGNYFSYYQIPQIMINEQLAPLIGVEMNWKFGLTTKFDYKKSRMLGMSFQDYQLSETKSKEITIGAGYRISGLTLPLKFGGKKITLDNDLAFNFDFSFRDNITTNYRLDQDVSEPTSGMRTIRFSPTIDYIISNQLRISLFYERTKNIPATSASYPITNSKGGIRINYTLSQ